MRIAPDVSWPLALDPADPYAGDEALPPDPTGPPSRMSDIFHRVRRGTLGVLDPEVAELVLHLPYVPRWVAALWSTSDPLAPLPPLVVHDPIPPPPVAPKEPSDLWFADIAEDIVPDLSLAAPDRVLGPLAEERPGPDLRLLSAAVMAFAFSIAPNVRAVDRWFSDRRGTPGPLRTAAHAVDLAPPCLWEVVDGTWRPHLPLDKHHWFDGEVQIGPRRDGEPSRPAADGWWIARVYQGPAGRRAACALRLPCPIPPRPFAARIVLTWLEERQADLTLYWTRFLRSRGELLYRHALERAWLEVDDARP